MTRQNFARLFLAAAVSTLAACAANEPVKQAATAAASTSPSATAAAPAGAPGKSTPPGFGYRRMTKDGVEYFCRREGVTGSRTEKAETCQTQAQIDQTRQDSVDLVKRIQDMPAQQQVNGSGGAMIGPMSR